MWVLKAKNFTNGFMVLPISLPFSRYLQTFFSGHYTHSCPYLLVRKKLLLPVVLTERLKKNIFDHKIL